MMSWFEDIESLSNKTGEARNAFVRKASTRQRHVRSVSGMSTNSEVMEDDEADRTPYSAESVVLANGQERPMSATRQPGGAFPSDVQIDRHLQAPLSPSSGDSSAGREMIAAAGAIPDGTTAGPSRYYTGRDVDNVSQRGTNESPASRSRMSRHDSYYGDWIGPTAIVGQQKKSQLSEAANADNREIRSDGDHNSVVAMSGVVEAPDRRDHSAPAQVARRESVSTAPTNTNVTDYTNNTLATSVDDTHESKPAGIMGVDSAPFSGFEDGYADRSFVNGAGGTAKTGPDLSRPKQDSVVAIDMKIPGRFPPTNVAA
jgi:hypothetical protein